MSNQVEVEVVHPKYHLAVKGKLQHIPKGAMVKMTEEAAKRAIERGMVKIPGNDEVLDATGGSDLDALRARAKELGINAGNMGEEKLKEKIAEAEAGGGQG
jgi:uncharacterized protein YunC (DUF1805 family)